jgi:hypothetical protein
MIFVSVLCLPTVSSRHNFIKFREMKDVYGSSMN